MTLDKYCDSLYTKLKKGMNQVKKYIPITIMLSTMLCLASCTQVPNEPPAENENEIVTDSPEEGITVAGVNRILGAETEDKVLGVYVDDYNGDGISEAYALTASSESDEEEPYIAEASLWFIKKDSAECLATGNLGKQPSVFDFADKKLLSTYVYSDKGISTSVYFVSGNHAYSYGSYGGRLIRDSESKEKFYLVKTERDADYNMKSSEFDKESSKPYYLFFDGNFFVEYGGREMREDQLRAINGADEILTAISEGGYIIDTIYCRDNGVINVNLSKDNGSGIIGRENVTLFLDEATVRLVPTGASDSPFARINDIEVVREIISEKFAVPEKFSYSGTYLAAAIPDIAEYPMNARH